MKLFIQIEIGRWQQNGYDKPWLHYASSLSDDIVGTDLDNESETMVADLVIQLLRQAEKVFILVQAHDPEAMLGSVSKVFQMSQQHPERISRVVLNGEHTETEQVAGGWTQKFIKASEDSAIRDLIRDFAQ